MHSVVQEEQPEVISSADFPDCVQLHRPVFLQGPGRVPQPVSKPSQCYGDNASVEDFLKTHWASSIFVNGKFTEQFQSNGE